MSMPAAPVCRQLIVQIVGYKNTGKTTMVCRLTEQFKQAGYKVGTIKHDAHSFDMDRPGTDTWLHQAAGADMTAISSSAQSAILYRESLSLEEMIIAMDSADIILIEGYKNAAYPKLLLLRTAEDLELLQMLNGIAAIAVWPEAMPLIAPLLPLEWPVADINDGDKLFELAIAAARL